MKKSLISFVLPFFVTAIIAVIFFNDISLSDIFNNISRIPLSYFMLFVILTIIGTLLRAYRYYILLSGKVSFFDLVLITLVRNFSVDLLPARTASLAFYVILLKKRDVSTEEGSSSFVISVFYDGLALVLMLSGLLFFIDTDQLWVGIYISMGIIFLISVIAVFFSDRIIYFIINLKIVKKFEKLHKFLSDVFKYLELHKSRKERLILFGLSFLIRLIKYVFVFVLFSAIMEIVFNISIFSKFSFALAGTEMSSLLPIQGLGGFGTWELAFKLLFESLNVIGENTSRLSITSFAEAGIVIHIVTQVWEYSIGIIAFFIFTFKKGLQKK